MPTPTKKNKQEVADGWSQDGQTLILSGMGYRTKKDLTQVCIGPVDQGGEPLTAPQPHPALIEQGADAFQNSPQVLVDGQPSFETNNKHPGGRPRKSGDDISRVTQWRREREKQGILI